LIGIVELDFTQLRELLMVMGQTDVSELSLKSGELELTLRKGGVSGDRVLSPSMTTGAVVLPTPPVAAAPATPPTSEESQTAPRPSPHSAERLLDITSPMVGTFYRAPAPDEPPFVDRGDRIRSGQTVCIIEAMKLMNELEAEVSGEIVEILVENAEPVEYGQVLMRVKPD
jgi:acetyl-CoA carboxylase biotin carboxyl carrier protein